jgi:hypothetical protein
MSIHTPGIQSLSLGFENCEYVDIRVSFIGLFYVKNIQTSLGKVQCANSKYIEIDYHKSCDSFVISLYRTYNEVWKNSGGKGYNHFNELFERLKYTDMVNISIKKSNDVFETIYLPADFDPHKNKYQRTVENKFGDLFIFVSRDDSEFNFYDENMNDEDYINDMFSIDELEKYSKQFTQRNRLTNE